MEDGEVVQYKLLDMYPFRKCSSNHCSTKREGRNNLRFILLGKTGTGMSSLGNFILRRRAFTSKLSCRSVTQMLESQSAKLHRRQISVIDTPGLYNTEMTMADNAMMIQDSLSLTEPGPHVFILLIQTGRFTDEVVKMITMYKLIFGPYFLHYTIVAFTHEEQTAIGEQNIKDFFKDFKGSPIGKSLLGECHQRYIFLNMKETNEEILMRKRNTLIQRVDELSGNGIQYYADKFDMHRDALLKHFETWAHNSWTLEQVKSVLNDQEGKTHRQEQEPRGQEEDDQRKKETNLQEERKQQEKERHETERYNELKKILRQEEERRKCEEEMRQDDARKRRQDEERQWFVIFFIAAVAIATLSITKIRVRLQYSR